MHHPALRPHSAPRPLPQPPLTDDSHSETPFWNQHISSCFTSSGTFCRKRSQTWSERGLLSYPRPGEHLPVTNPH